LQQQQPADFIITGLLKGEMKRIRRGQSVQGTIPGRRMSSSPAAQKCRPNRLHADPWLSISATLADASPGEAIRNTWSNSVVADGLPGRLANRTDCLIRARFDGQGDPLQISFGGLSSPPRSNNP